MGEMLKELPTKNQYTYAGRLDPLASGVCVVLSGEDRHQKEAYLKLPKEYLVDVLFGVETDTLDPLGLATEVKEKENLIRLNDLNSSINEFLPNYEQIPPRYSSIPSKGQPSFIHARNNSDETPTSRKVSIESVELVELHTVNKSDLLSETVARVKQVNGDFRQTETLDKWSQIKNELPNNLSVCKLRVTCGSGTYMRSLARDLGKKLNTPSIALRIIRTRVGDFRLPFQE